MNDELVISRSRNAAWSLRIIESEATGSYRGQAINCLKPTRPLPKTTLSRHHTALSPLSNFQLTQCPLISLFISRLPYLPSALNLLPGATYEYPPIIGNHPLRFLPHGLASMNSHLFENCASDGAGEGEGSFEVGFAALLHEAVAERRGIA